MPDQGHTYKDPSQWPFASLLCSFIGIWVLDCDFSLTHPHILTIRFSFDYDIKNVNFHKNLDVKISNVNVHLFSYILCVVLPE